MDRATIGLAQAELRASRRKGITGYAAVYYDGTSATEFRVDRGLHKWRERIEHGAFDSVLDSDVYALFNHNPDFPLGRTAANTLEIWSDDKGLGYRITPGNSDLHDRVFEAVERGDVDGSSFGFMVEEDGEEMERGGDGSIIRTIKRVSKLGDVGPVVGPAYKATSAETRSLPGALTRLLAAERERLRQEIDRVLS